MKKFAILIPLLVLSLVAKAQDSQEKSDTTKIKMGKSTIIIVGNSDADDYDIDLTDENGGCDGDTVDDGSTVFVDLGFNGYAAPGFEITLPNSLQTMELDYTRSHTLAWSIMLKEASIIPDRLYLRAGFDLAHNSYAFNNNINIGTSNDSTVFSSDSVITYDKYKLNTNYLQVPLILGVRLGNLEKPVGLQAGVIGGYKLRSKAKVRYTIDDAKYKSKVIDNYNLRPFRLDAVARLTIGDFGFFAKYNLTSMFENNKAPEVYAFSAGITFGEF